MVGTYDVYMNGERKGTASVTKHGLYYSIKAHCSHPEREILHLLIHGTNWTEDLGVMVPTALGWELKKQIPMKRIGEGTLRFSMERGTNTTEKELIDPTIALSSLSCLEQAYLEISGEQQYLVWRKNS